MNKYKVLEVKWIDSVSGDCTWQLSSEFKPSISKPTSYGFLIYEDTEKICLAQTIATEDGELPEQINGVITIPKVAILEMKEINSDAI